jgi:hypothetical protein
LSFKIEQASVVPFAVALTRVGGFGPVILRRARGYAPGAVAMLPTKDPILALGADLENVGNLVCPSSYDLGENLRLVLLSVTEGEDKPLKYPTIFNSADVAVITKMDLAEAVEFDEETMKANIQAVRPGMQHFTVSAKTGAGLQEYLQFLKAGLAALRETAPV